MKEIIIQIRYGDKYGDNQGCTTVRLPAWLEEAPLPKIKGLLKLAAQKAADDANAGEILRLEAYITNAIEEAKTDLAATEKIEDRRERGAEKRRKHGDQFSVGFHHGKILSVPAKRRSNKNKKTPSQKLRTGDSFFCGTT